MVGRWLLGGRMSRSYLEEVAVVDVWPEHWLGRMAERLLYLLLEIRSVLRRCIFVRRVWFAKQESQNGAEMHTASANAPTHVAVGDREKHTSRNKA